MPELSPQIFVGEQSWPGKFVEAEAGQFEGSLTQYAAETQLGTNSAMRSTETNLRPILAVTPTTHEFF